MNPIDLESFGPTQPARLGDVVLVRSGDKGGNANIGFFIPTALPSSYPHASPLCKECWDWLRTFLTMDKLMDIFADSWEVTFFIERCEFQRIMAVHFVVYWVLGRE